MQRISGASQSRDRRKRRRWNGPGSAARHGTPHRVRGTAGPAPRQRHPEARGRKLRALSVILRREPSEPRRRHPEVRHAKHGASKDGASPHIDASPRPSPFAAVAAQRHLRVTAHRGRLATRMRSYFSGQTLRVTAVGHQPPGRTVSRTRCSARAVHRRAGTVANAAVGTAPDQRRGTKT